jgi:hypothetical protein
MSQRRYRRIRHRASGLVFVFAYDSDDPSLLHIYARHLTSPADGMRTYFEGETTWNARRRRFETSTLTHGLFW